MSYSTMKLVKVEINLNAQSTVEYKQPVIRNRLQTSRLTSVMLWCHNDTVTALGTAVIWWAWLAQSCESWPIRADGALKRQALKQSGGWIEVLRQWTEWEFEH